MRKIGKILFMALELLSYIAFIVGLLAILSLAFSTRLGNCAMPNMYYNCDNKLYDQIANLSQHVIFIYVLTVLPMLLGLLGILLGLRRIHHIKTARLLAEGRIDEVEKLRYFLLISSKYVVISAIVLGLIIAALWD